MTREDAIKILKSKMDGHVDTSYEWAEIVRMAIVALENENKLLDEVLEIIDWRLSLFGKTAADELIKQELHIIKEEIERANK